MASSRYWWNSLLNCSNVVSCDNSITITSVTKHDLKIFSFLEQTGFIRSYSIITPSHINRSLKISVSLGHYNALPLIKKILTSMRGRKFIGQSVSYSKLRVMAKNTTGVFLIHSPFYGLIDHTKALAFKQGGVITAFVE